MLFGSKKVYGAVLAVLILVLVIVTTPALVGAEAKSDQKSTAKNVIMMIPDGASSTHYTLARWYKGGSMALDELPVGLVRTYGGESIITDSAPAATAFATGHKTSDKYVGVLPGPVTIPGVDVPSTDDQYKPVASILEAAKLKGMSVGLVATCNIQHATPAGFSAHITDRNNYNEIAEQQVYEDIDVVFGGGSQYLLPTGEGGMRTDDTDLTEVLVSRGYSYITTKSQMEGLSSSTSKVWGMFAPNAMAHDFDRFLYPEQPSIAEMTDKAIEILSKNPRGFFLMVEGSQVDWSSHANDPVGVISEMLAFDDAAKVALDFAKQDRKTMIMSFTDHGNGGMTIGNKNSDSTYSKMKLSSVIDPLKKAKCTGYALMEILGTDVTDLNVKAKVLEYYGLELTDKEVASILSKYDQTNKKWTIDLDYVLGPMMSNRSYIGWTTTGHTGEDVTLYAYGPGAPHGLLDNTDLARVAERSLGLSLNNAEQKLYNEASSAFSGMRAQVSIDTTNRELVVTKNGAEIATMPLSSDLLNVGGKTYQLSGVVIYAEKSGKAYVPQDAVRLVKSITSMHTGCGIVALGPVAGLI
ncbi:MAG: alkaline phosphatase [Methanomassiliicoccus sp.]|nr:alkaline phosphatase [Methanomassiliicoccus sp.]